MALSFSALKMVIGIAFTVFASHWVGSIVDSRIALAAFLGIGTIVGLMMHRMKRNIVKTQRNYVPTNGGILWFQAYRDAGPKYGTEEQLDAAADVPWKIGYVLCFVAIAALAAWGVLTMDHGALRTFIGFVGGVAAYEAAVSPLVSLVFPHF